MAKKKKTKNNSQNKFLCYLPLLFAVLTVAMIFLVAVVGTGKLFGSESQLSGLEVVFGMKETTTVFGKEITTEILKFSILGLVAYLLPLVAGLVAPVLKNKIGYLLSALLFLAGAVLLFMMPNFVVFATEQTLKVVELSLGIGSILAGVFAGLGALVSGYAFLTSKK